MCFSRTARSLKRGRPLKYLARLSSRKRRLSWSGRSSKRRIDEPHFLYLGRAGFPATVWPGATSQVTTAPAPMMASSPMVTPGKINAPPPVRLRLCRW